MRTKKNFIKRRNLGLHIKLSECRLNKLELSLINLMSIFMRTRRIRFNKQNVLLVNNITIESLLCNF